MNKTMLASYLAYKMPIAKLAGLKLKSYNEEKCQIYVKHGWLNQNPFRSMFWAVQGMAAELSTGLMCSQKIKDSGVKISMLVVGLQANFSKKAVGKIVFSCNQGKEIDEILKKAIETGEGQTLTLHSKGFDEAGDEVSEFSFTWSFKTKK